MNIAKDGSFLLHVKKQQKSLGACFERRKFSTAEIRKHVRRVQNPGWLFDIGDYTTQLYGDYFTSHYKDPY